MEIFNVQIFGSDKEYWLEQTVEWKVEWIRNNTLQQNDATIEDFVNNPRISTDKICLTCGDKANYSNPTMSDEIEIFTEEPIIELKSFDKKSRFKK